MDNTSHNKGKSTFVKHNPIKETPIEPSIVYAETTTSPQRIFSATFCQLHGKVREFYCEKCEEVICLECKKAGGHILHVVLDCKEAFDQRLSILIKCIDPLETKRGIVLAQMERVKYRIKEINVVGGVIEKDIKLEYAGILERMKYNEGDKLAILLHDQFILQKDVERTNKILDTIDSYINTKDKEKMVELVKNYSEISEYIEYVLVKPFKQEIDITTNDLSNEYCKQRAIIEESEKIEELLNLKDKLISNTINKDWKYLGLLYEKQVKNYQMICGYCGNMLNELIINQSCLKNGSVRKLRDKYIIEEIPSEYNGNGSHFFGHPLIRSKNFINQIMIDRKASIAFNAIRNSSRTIAIRIIKSMLNGNGRMKFESFVNKFKNEYDVEDECFYRLGEVFKQEEWIEYKELVDYIKKLFNIKDQELTNDHKHINQNNFSLNIVEDSNIEKKVNEKESKNELKQLINNNPDEKNYKARDEEKELVESIRKTLRDNKITKEGLMNEFKRYDTLKRCIVPIDVVYLIFAKLHILITNVDIAILLKRLDGESLKRGNINYYYFLNKLL